MNDNSFKLANYWRNCTADAENGNGALSTSQARKLTALPIEALFSGCVPAEQVSLLFANETAESACVEITLRPLVYKSRSSTAKPETDFRRSSLQLYVECWSPAMVVFIRHRKP